MKLALFFTLILSAATSFASEWNHVTCFYRTKGAETALRYQEHSIENFYLDMGESKILTTAWTTNRGPNVGICTKLLSLGSDNSVYVNYKIFHADTITNISQFCEVTGTNVTLVESGNKLVNRGQKVSFTIPWDLPFDTATFTEYIPTMNEIQDIGKVAKTKCQEILSK